MGKTFEVRGIAKCVLIYRGLAVQPKRVFHLFMNENEFNTFKDNIDIISCNEVELQKSEPVIEEKPKGDDENVELHKSNTIRKRKSKASV